MADMAASKKEKGKSHFLVEIVQNYGVELGLKLFHEHVLKWHVHHSATIEYPKSAMLLRGGRDIW